jgi:hypothetical protein
MNDRNRNVSPRNVWKFWQPIFGLPLLGLRAARWRSLRGNWLPGYLTRRQSFDRSLLEKGAPVDVIVVMVDHFEPQDRLGDNAAAESVASWCQEYERVACKFTDADGRHPQHTWFYRAEYPNSGCLRILSDYTFRGLGEVEFHLHHGHDTEDSFAAKIREGLDFFNRFGAMITAEPEPQRRFAYIAGNWALDNGAGDDSKSGCNTELKVLRDAGCYADFTFPALGSYAQPRKTNAIYYASDDPGPKSYDSGVDVESGRPACGDLLIFQGPLQVDWRAGAFEWGALETYAPPTAARLDRWLNAHIHVKGRPEWAFMKLHTHGMQSRQTFLGASLEACLQDMVERWNRRPFRLHFVTAREAYNIVKAAEAGLTGDPNDYRNYQVQLPANRVVRCSSEWQLQRFEPGRIQLRCLERNPVTIEFAKGPLQSVSGMIEELDYAFQREKVVKLQAIPPVELQVSPREHEKPRTKNQEPKDQGAGKLRPGI